MAVCFDCFSKQKSTVSEMENFLPATSNWLRKHHTSGVHSLEDSLKVHSPGDLSNQHRSYSLGSKLLVNTKEVNFNHQDSPEGRKLTTNVLRHFLCWDIFNGVIYCFNYNNWYTHNWLVKPKLQDWLILSDHRVPVSTHTFVRKQEKIPIEIHYITKDCSLASFQLWDFRISSRLQH